MNKRITNKFDSHNFTPQLWPCVRLDSCYNYEHVEKRCEYFGVPQCFKAVHARNFKLLFINVSRWEWVLFFIFEIIYLLSTPPPKKQIKNKKNGVRKSLKKNCFDPVKFDNGSKSFCLIQPTAYHFAIAQILQHC